MKSRVGYFNCTVSHYLLRVSGAGASCEYERGCGWKADLHTSAHMHTRAILSGAGFYFCVVVVVAAMKVADFLMLLIVKSRKK